MTPSQTFHDHISELRRRLAWVAAVIGISSGVGYALRKPILTFLQHPLGAPLFYSSPAGSFNFILKTSTMLGIIIALPLIVYHLIRFIEPALSSPIKRRVIAVTILSATALALMGTAFGFFIMVPMSLHFFSTYSSATIKPLISADAYLTFVLNMLVTFGLIFQIPLVTLFINRIKPIKPSKMLRYQRHVVVGAFVLAVVLPFTYDPISQLIMAIPIVFLFYLSVMLVWIANRRVVYDIEIPAEDTTELVAQESIQQTGPQPAHAPIQPTWSGTVKPLRQVHVYRPQVLSLSQVAKTTRAASVRLPKAQTDRQVPDSMRVHPLNVIDLSKQA